MERCLMPKPRLFMFDGGAGSGKTAVEEIAQALCGDNFVMHRWMSSEKKAIYTRSYRSQPS